MVLAAPVQRDTLNSHNDLWAVCLRAGRNSRSFGSISVLQAPPSVGGGGGGGGSASQPRVAGLHVVASGHGVILKCPPLLHVCCELLAVQVGAPAGSHSL